ncbi:MAG: binding-protein-dependent transport system inner rane component [Chloroflexi bacterium]|jgi:alpha-glucoside transport system permease protein|nr:binding-protein-dependent transport system inner rane component [Chloroflexota bacterium]
MALVQGRAAGTRRSKIINGVLVNGILALICILWTVPTIGLLVSSFRPRADVVTNGWWNVLPHQEYVTVNQIQLTPGLPLDQPIQVEGQTLTDDQLRAGFKLPDGRKVVWANRRSRTVDVQNQQWTAKTNFTLNNYDNVLIGQEYTTTDAAGNTKTEKGENMSNAFISSLTVAIPATIIPILIAAFAAYAFAWMRFPGRKTLFAMVVGLLVIPAQVALIPLLTDFSALGITGTYLSLWLVHTGFGLCLAIYLLYNYISQLPREILESAFIDGASPFTIFIRLILPLSVPALASFAIFQFMWVWNDYLNALIFLGTAPDTQVVTIKLAQMLGSRGQDWHLLTAGAFVSMVLPLIVFFSLQRYFVRGMMAGSVKG